MNRPGVLMVTGAYWPELSGGGLQARTMIQALHDRFGFRVWTTAVDRALPSESVIDGVPVSRVHVDLRSRWSKIVAAFSALAYFIAHGSTFDIVHLHGFSKKSIVIVMLARLFGKKVVTTIHTAEQDEPDAVRRLGTLAAWSYMQSDRFVAISNRIATNATAQGIPSTKLRLMPNGVDTVRFHPATPDERQRAKTSIGTLPADVPWVLFVGFFSRDKSPDVLFDAWLRLQYARPRSCALLFVGATESVYHEVDRSIAADIRRRSEAAGVGDLVHFTGEMTDVERAFRAGDVFVMPSVREAFGMALIEAMASGVPSIATRIEGVTDTIAGDGGALLAPPRDVEALRQALEQVLGSSETATLLATRGRDKVVSDYSLVASAERWRALYEEVLA